jgi:hypothetical protein
VIDIATEHQDNILAALAELGLERHGSMSALLDPYNDDPNAGGGISEPDTDNLTMACSGTFSNGSRFTVNYTREAGFSRFTLDPGSGSPVTVNLTYSGTTDAQYGVWKGTLSESEVRVDHLSSQAYRACRIDLLEADDQAFDSIETLLRWFCCRMAHELELDFSVNDLWDPDLGSQVNGGIFLQQVLAQAEPPLMLSINALEQVFCHETVARDFLALLRCWHERSKDSGPWQRLRLVLVYSTDSYVALNLETSPFNMGHSMRLPPFTLQQFLELGRRYGLPHVEDPGQRFSLEALYRLIAGHPYLANLSFYTLTQEQKSLPEILNTATGSDSIFRSHLQEMGAQLRHNPTVLAAWQRVIEGQGVPLNAVDSMGLESLGLIRTEQGLAFPLCDLYQRFFAAQGRRDLEDAMPPVDDSRKSPCNTVAEGERLICTNE